MLVEEDHASEQDNVSESEELESVTLNVHFNDERYDEEIDFLEEKKELQKIKGNYLLYIYYISYYNFYILSSHLHVSDTCFTTPPLP